MSYRLNVLQITERIHTYLMERYPAQQVSDCYFVQDVRVFDEPNIAFYPDMENRFLSHKSGVEYLLDSGLPIWAVSRHNNYPMDYFTLDKIEHLFNL